MRSYVKVKPSDKFPMTIPEQRKMSDEIWKEHILNYIQAFYKETPNDEIEKVIEKARKKKPAKIERAICKHVKKWFRNNEDFLYKGFNFELEPESEGKKEGFYDIKIQHSYWNYQKSYFPFECKNLGTSILLNEYVFVDTKSKTDGGMYRYFIDEKYAVNQNFGGMIGFVIQETKTSVVEELIEKIETIYLRKEIGRLCGRGIVRNSIFDNQNTFESHHQRAKDEIVIHHIIMDFVN